MPVMMAWSTPGAALLISTGVPDGGFPAAVGAFLVTSVLLALAGIWRRFGEAVAAIPLSLASAMLAGILLDLCLAPMRATAAMPALALPIVAAWLLAWRFARRYAMPVAMLVAAVMITAATDLPPGVLQHSWPTPILVVPDFTLGAVVGIALPLFIVTMAAQNVPGLAVLNANGYRPEVGPIFVTTGLAGLVISCLGGHAVNLAALTAALTASPEADPDPSRRWIAAVTAGIVYIALGLIAGMAAAFIAASPPLLIQAVAGLALLGSLASALATALAKEPDRLSAIITFVTAASGISFFGVGAAFWGLVAGGITMLVGRQ
jgi:benzoate membrane transport protein